MRALHIEFPKAHLNSLLTVMILFIISAAAGVNASDDPGKKLDIGKFDLNIRSYYIKRSYSIASPQESLAIGGWLGYRTPWWHNLMAGVTVFTSQGLIFTDPDKGGAGILGPQQNGYTALGDAYLKGKVSKTELTVFRQELDTPFINPHDSRMTPNTFEAYTLTSKDIPLFTLLVSHVAKIKPWTDTSFESMSEAAGVAGTNEPVTMAGVVFEPASNYKLNLWEYYCNNLMNIIYARGDGEWKYSGDLAFVTSLQFLNQQDVGNALAGSFNTGMFGVQETVKWKGWGVTFAYTATSSDHDIINPWAGYPGFTAMIVKDDDRAGENTWLAGLSYDFSTLGINGLSAFSNFANSSTPKTGPHVSPSQNELDFTVDYRFQKLLDGLWIRLRTAFITQDKSMGGQDMQDYRVIVNYRIPF
ncbi:MAG: OprD family outer membrane porin [Syntrophales bacterium]